MSAKSKACAENIIITTADCIWETRLIFMGHYAFKISVKTKMHHDREGSSSHVNSFIETTIDALSFFMMVRNVMNQCDTF